MPVRKPTQKLSTWNVNGLRSVARRGFQEWFEANEMDVVCLQEIKVQQEQLSEELLHPNGYHSFWHSAKKPGYSGVATYCRDEPQDVRYGIGIKEIDQEGRVLTTEFKNFSLVNAYFPNSQRDHARLDFKIQFCKAMLRFCEREREKGKSVLVCGDFNIAHQEIDLRNPKTNTKNAGFLPEERAWMSEFLAKGYVDTFRHFRPQEGGHYTWWSYRPGVRERNIGWRLDYFVINQEDSQRLRAVVHQTDTLGSDHCPVSLEIQA